MFYSYTILSLLLSLLVLLVSLLTAKAVTVDVSKQVWKVNQRFLSVAIDSNVVAERWRNLDFSDPGVRSMASALAPAYVRLGGTAADLLIFDSGGGGGGGPPTSHDFEDSCGCDDDFLGRKKRVNFTMSSSDWDYIAGFSAAVGWKLLFDANVLLRTAKDKWDPDNLSSLLRYSSEKRRRFSDVAWELGNEPNSLHHQLNVTLSPTRLGRDFATLRHLLNSFPAYANSTMVGPDVNHLEKCVDPQSGKRRRRKCKALRYLEKVVTSSGARTLDALTWHQYYLDGHSAKLADFLRPEPLEQFERTLRVVDGFVRKELKLGGVPLWLGETGSAFGGGAKGLSDRYVAGFLWLDKLGMSALYRHDVVIRQSFYHGCYAMIGEDLLPNPDLWISVLHKRLVGRKVLRVIRSDGNKMLRLYAHCVSATTSAGGVVLFGANISPHVASVPLEPPLSDSGMMMQHVLSPLGGDLRSRRVLLNRRMELRLGPRGEMPEMRPARVRVGSGSHLVLRPFEMAFWHFPDVKDVYACSE